MHSARYFAVSHKPQRLRIHGGANAQLRQVRSEVQRQHSEHSLAQLFFLRQSDGDAIRPLRIFPAIKNSKRRLAGTGAENVDGSGWLNEKNERAQEKEHAVVIFHQGCPVN